MAFHKKFDGKTCHVAWIIPAMLKQAVDQSGADIVLLSSNRRGKELAGRLAQSMAAGCLTDVTGLKINGEQILCQRNALGGATLTRTGGVDETQPPVSFLFLT